MTICNKIQAVGEIMETNLNARGVSCTFGTGTGESTVLDMVEMVNGTNFKGSSDVNLKIGANRPYLLENETTDVIVRLEDGLCEPLKNKNVFIMQSTFQDSGVTGNKNTNWTNYSNRLTVTVSNDGTLLTKGSSNGYYLVNNSAFAYSDYVCEFDIVDIKGQCYWYHQYSSTSTQDTINFASYNTKGKHIKIISKDGTLKVYADGNQIGSDISLTTSTPFEMGFRINAHQTDERYFKYKNFIVYDTLTDGVTDEKGEFGLYNISVTDNTTFTATYNNTITDTCIVYSCLLVDYATTNKHTDIWANMDIFTRGNDGTRAYYQNTGSSALQRWLTSRININGDVGIDLELVDCTLCRFQTGRYATGSTTTYEGFNFTEKGLVHFEIKSTGTYIYFNGNLVQSDTTETNLEQISLAFYVGANITANAKYKDLRIYYL